MAHGGSDWVFVLGTAPRASIVTVSREERSRRRAREAAPVVVSARDGARARQARSVPWVTRAASLRQRPYILVRDGQRHLVRLFVRREDASSTSATSLAPAVQ